MFAKIPRNMKWFGPILKIHNTFRSGNKTYDCGRLLVPSSQEHFDTRG